MADLAYREVYRMTTPQARRKMFETYRETGSLRATALAVEARQRRDRLLAEYPQLATAWDHAQGFRQIYQAESRAQAAQALTDWWPLRRHGLHALLGL